MSRAQHTRGPWKVEFEAEPEEDRAAEIYVCHPGTVCDVTVVCTMGNSISGLMDQRTADARLIAAAPDLLAALHEATDFVDDAIKQWPAGSLELENARVIREHIDAAIAKATRP